MEKGAWQLDGMAKEDSVDNKKVEAVNLDEYADYLHLAGS